MDILHILFLITLIRSKTYIINDLHQVIVVSVLQLEAYSCKVFSTISGTSDKLNVRVLYCR